MSCLDTDEEINYTKDGIIMIELREMIEQYNELEGQILDILDDKENAMSDCNCDDCETISFVHAGEWEEIVKRCINCGGNVSDDR